jgi:hypothetical protein
MAEHKIVIEGREKDISTGPAVPIKPRMEREEERVERSVPAKRERAEAVPVVKRKSEVKKETFGDRMHKAMFGEKTLLESIEDTIIEQWIPGIKMVLFDGIFAAGERFLFGQVSDRSRRRDSSRGDSYNTPYRLSRERERDRDRDRDRRNVDIGEIWENIDPPMSYNEALGVLEKMRERADRDDYVTVADLLIYEGFDKKIVEWTDYGRGWYYEDLRSDKVDIAKVRGGYVLYLPRTRKVDDDRGYRR